MCVCMCEGGGCVCVCVCGWVGGWVCVCPFEILKHLTNFRLIYLEVTLLLARSNLRSLIFYMR